MVELAGEDSFHRDNRRQKAAHEKRLTPASYHLKQTVSPKLSSRSSPPQSLLPLETQIKKKNIDMFDSGFLESRALNIRGIIFLKCKINCIKCSSNGIHQPFGGCYRISETTKILSFDHISTNQFIGNPETV